MPRTRAKSAGPRPGPEPTLIQLDERGPRDDLPPGIARMAAAAPEVDFRNEVSYSRLDCKSLIAHCDSPRVPFRWSINPYRGCEFGCAYCYARYPHEYLELEDWRDFERRIYVKQNGAALLAEELRRNRRTGEWIAIGT